MRDKKRIKPFLDRLGKVWEENASDWRFGQLMVNISRSMDRDMFFSEDDEMIEFIENYFNKKNK